MLTWLAIRSLYCLISWLPDLLTCALLEQLICSPDSPCLISWSAHLTGHLVEELPAPGLQGGVLVSWSHYCLISWSSNLTLHLIASLPDQLTSWPAHLTRPAWSVDLLTWLALPDQLICSPDWPSGRGTAWAWPPYCLISWSAHLTDHLVEELLELGLRDNPVTWSLYCLISWSAHRTRLAWSADLLTWLAIWSRNCLSLAWRAAFSSHGHRTAWSADLLTWLAIWSKNCLSLACRAAFSSPRFLFSLFMAR